MLKYTKTLIICGLLVIAIVLAGLLIAMSKPPAPVDDVTPIDITEPSVYIEPIIVTDPEPETTNEPTTVTEIETTTEVTTEAITEPATEAATDNSVVETVNNIELTVIEPKPKTPENTTATPVEPVKPKEPKENTQKNGAKNEQGQVYVEGFGWVTQGGENIRKDSYSDGDWDKQIGIMG